MKTESNFSNQIYTKQRVAKSILTLITILSAMLFNNSYGAVNCKDADGDTRFLEPLEELLAVSISVFDYPEIKDTSWAVINKLGETKPVVPIETTF